MNFSHKLDAAIARNQSLLCVGLEPNPEVMPTRYSKNPKTDDSVANLYEWMQFIIETTNEFVCAYKPTLGFYTALGAPGLELLSQVLAAIPKHIPIILDAKHSDLNSSTVMAQTAFEQWQVDAITLNPYVGQDLVARFLMYADKAVFMHCHTANATANSLQEYPSRETPLYLQTVKECRTWGTFEQLGLEVGASTPEALARVRAIAPERLILARSVWANSPNAHSQDILPEPNLNLEKILEVGFNANGENLIIAVSQDILASTDPTIAMRSLCQQIDLAKTAITTQRPTCPVWFPDVCLLDKHPHFDLILQLYDIGCIMFGEYVQASGAVFPYYIDLRKIISNPQVFDKVLSAYAEILKPLNFDRIAGIPYGSLPTATGLSLRLNYPMIFPRKEVKAHGARRLIEGNFNVGETIVVVDDILISGKSAMEGAEKIKSCGLNVQDIVVFIDHEQGVKDRLAACGYRSHSVLGISEITNTLYESGRLTLSGLEALRSGK